jgi:hypothetical protein
MLPAHEGVANTDALSDPINMPPPQPQQLGLPQTGDRRDQHDHPHDRTPHVGRHRWRWASTTEACRRRLWLHDLVRDRRQHAIQLL